MAPLHSAQAQVPAVTTTPVFDDEFNSGSLNPAAWSVTGNNITLEDTQWGNAPTFGTDADGTKFVRLGLSTYNANPGKAGVAFLGTQIASLDRWNVGSGLEYESRIRSNNLPPGLVIGYFAYGDAQTWPNTYQKTETDYEFLTSGGGGQIWLNIWDDWNPVRGGPNSGTTTSIANLNWNNGGWNDFKIHWYPDRTEWIVNNVIVRTEKVVVPGRPMAVWFNLWGPSSGWGAAYSASMRPTSAPASNQNYFYDVDYVKVRPIPYTGTAQIGNGTGLTGSYYDNADFTGANIVRTDSRVNFDWNVYAPDPSMGVDSFSARWTGSVQGQYSEPYTFYVKSDDGARLWVNNQLIINNWVDQGATEKSGTIALQAGVKVPIKLEYYDNTGNASATMSWSSASTPKQIVPQSQLYVAAQPAKPSFSPAGGTYTSAQSVAITSSTAGATIRYTLDGSDPTASSAVLASGAKLSVSANALVRARAFVTGQVPSDSATASYIVSLPTDKTPPTLNIFSPATNIFVQALPNITGTATDSGSGVKRVDIVLTRSSDGLAWSGSGWSSGAVGLPTTLNGSNWTLSGTLPTGANLPSGTYEIKAVGYDNAGNISAKAQKIIVDVVGPNLTFTAPQNGATVSSLAGIRGTASDVSGGSGVDHVDMVIIRQSDGMRWNGWQWLSGFTGIPTQFSGSTWSVIVPGSNGAGIPTGSNLPNGNYQLIAAGYDKVGNYNDTSITVTVKASVSAAAAAITAPSAPKL